MCQIIRYLLLRVTIITRKCTTKVRATPSYQITTGGWNDEVSGLVGLCHMTADQEKIAQRYSCEYGYIENKGCIFKARRVQYSKFMLMSLYTLSSSNFAILQRKSEP